MSELGHLPKSGWPSDTPVSIEFRPQQLLSFSELCLQLQNAEGDPNSPVWRVHKLYSLCGSRAIVRLVRDGLPRDHRKMPLGPDAVTYSSDPVGFLIEFDLNLFLIAMGGLGVLVACREIIIEIAGRKSRLLSFVGWRYANEVVSRFVGLGLWFLLIVFAYGVFHRFVL
jgi:hypothetical protein